jgi:hypothetical protein
MCLRARRVGVFPIGRGWFDIISFICYDEIKIKQVRYATEGKWQMYEGIFDRMAMCRTYLNGMTYMTEA